MKAVKFKQQNCVYAKNQKQYIPLLVHKINEPEGRVISCWKGRFRDRLRFLFNGRIFLSCMTFNKPLQPLDMQTENPFAKDPTEEKFGPADPKSAKKYIHKERKKNENT